MCKVTMFIAISSKFLWASFYHRYVRNDQRVSPQDPRPREEDHTVYWLVSGLNTNGDVESHPPEKKNPHIHHAFWGVLNIRRKDPVNSATSWFDCAGFSSRFFEETIYYIGMFVPAKETSLNTRIHKPCIDTLKEHPKYLVSTTGSAPFSP